MFSASPCLRVESLSRAAINRPELTRPTPSTTGTHGTVTSRRVPSPRFDVTRSDPPSRSRRCRIPCQAETARADSLRIESDSGIGNHQHNPVFRAFDLD